MSLVHVVLALSEFDPDGPRVAGAQRGLSVSLVVDMCVSSTAGCTAVLAGQLVELADLFVEGA